LIEGEFVVGLVGKLDKGLLILLFCRPTLQAYVAKRSVFLGHMGKS